MVKILLSIIYLSIGIIIVTATDNCKNYIQKIEAVLIWPLFIILAIISIIVNKVYK